MERFSRASWRTKARGGRFGESLPADSTYSQEIRGTVNPLT